LLARALLALVERRDAFETVLEGQGGPDAEEKKRIRKRDR
jgi:hypothetical protein